MEATSSGSGSRSVRATLTSLLDEFSPENSMPPDPLSIPVETDLNFKLLEEATKLLQRIRAESNREIDRFRRNLEEKDAETRNLRDRLRHQEERERTLVEENRALRVKIMGLTSQQPERETSEISVPKEVSVTKVEVGVQVELMYEGPHFHSCSGLAHNAEEEDGFPFSEDVVGEEGVRIPASVLRERFLQVRNFRRRRRKRLALEPPQDIPQFEGYPRLRPIIQKKNGMKEGGEIVGYQWSHYTEHEFLRVNPAEPLPPDLLEEEEEMEEEEGEEDNEEKEEDDDEVEIIKEIGVPPKGSSGAKENVALDENKENLKQGNPVTIDVNMAEPAGKEDEESEPVFHIKKSNRESCMMTTSPYYVAEELEDYVSEVLARPEKEAFVEVPSWRKVPLPEELIRPENEPIEEDVSEAAVLRRHSRLELDEKRRKRWDSQRVREETYLERLKRRMEERENQKTKRRRRKLNNSVPSKHGENKDGNSDDEGGSKDMQGQIRYIRVAEDIPITVFGYPMPIIERSEFHLPWMPSCDEDTPEEEDEEDVPYASEEEESSPDLVNDSCDISSGGELTTTTPLPSAIAIPPSLSLSPAKENVKQSLLSVLQ